MKIKRHLIPLWQEGRQKKVKCLFTCFLLCVLMTQAIAQEQANRITLDLQQANMLKFVRQVKQQTGYSFFYNDKLLQRIEPITIKCTNASLDEVLQTVFVSKGLEAIREGSTVVIKEQKKTKGIEVRGKVVDGGGLALPGVTIMVKGTTLGVTSDIDGNYSIKLPEMKNVALMFTFIGMKSKEVAYTGQQEINVTLEEDVMEMDEVVVTGIFERKKEGFTGSATTVTKEDIKKMTSGNVLKALEMLDPAFKMTSSNIAGSNPNAVPDFQMRGQANMGNYEATDVVVMRGDVNTRPNQPLFVLDGVIGVDATTIMDLDPEQVESITLLKDAAATVIYGSDAANGVVVVETRAPETGKLRFTYNGN